MNNQLSEYRELILYVDYHNETSLVLNGEEVFNYLYNKIAMDIYTKGQSRLDTTDAENKATIKWMLSCFVFYLFCRMVFYILRYIVRLLFGFSKPKPIRIVVNDYR